FGTPSAASLLISAQSSKVITLQSLSAHFSPPKLFSFRAPPTHGLEDLSYSAADRCDVIPESGEPSVVEFVQLGRVTLEDDDAIPRLCLVTVKPREAERQFGDEVAVLVGHQGTVGAHWTALTRFHLLPLGIVPPRHGC
ncbi:hypothetical protein, partial [Jatrophihabitans lederbergiae]